MTLSLKHTNDRYRLFKSEKLQRVGKVEAALLRGARNWLDENGYTEIQVPHIVNATGSCEIIDTLFDVPYFKKTAYLSQTGQLYLESVVPFFNGKVWTCGRSFRAEPQVDDRHLCEFTLLELEFEGGFDKLFDTVENLLAAMMSEVRNTIEFPRIEFPQVKFPFTRLKYEDAIKMLGFNWGMDFHSPDEQKLIEMNYGQPLFITHFPKELKYFNMRQNDSDPRVVNSADLLLPKAGESAGCAEREHVPIKLRSRLLESGMWIQYMANGGDKTAFDWYLHAYEKYTYKLHSGFGMGINRVTKWIMQLDDIRETTIFPVNSATLY